MKLEDVKIEWDVLKDKEKSLENQLQLNRDAQTAFFKEAVQNGFYWSDGEWKQLQIIGCKSSSWECLCIDCSSPRGSEECREFRESNGMNEDWVE